MTIKGKFYIDVYSCHVHIIYTDQIERSANYYCKKYELDSPGPVEGVVINGNLLNYYLLINKEYCTVDTFNHEKSHMVEHILKHRNIRPIGEPRAYLDGCVSRKLNLFFKKKKIKIKD